MKKNTKTILFVAVLAVLGITVLSAASAKEETFGGSGGGGGGWAGGDGSWLEGLLQLLPEQPAFENPFPENPFPQDTGTDTLTAFRYPFRMPDFTEKPTIIGYADNQFGGPAVATPSAALPGDLSTQSATTGANISGGGGGGGGSKKSGGGGGTGKATVVDTAASKVMNTFKPKIIGYSNNSQFNGGGGGGGLR